MTTEFCYSNLICLYNNTRYDKIEYVEKTDYCGNSSETSQFWRYFMFYKNLAPVYHHVFPANDKIPFLNDVFKGCKKLIDVGCADGRVAKALVESQLEYKITGIDLSSDLIEVAKEVTAPLDQINLIHLDMKLLGSIFPANSFEGLYCIGNTLVHLENIETITKVLTDFNKLLTPNGKMVIQILNYDKILQEKITTLPLIDNEFVRFERYYTFLEGKIKFDSLLSIKANDKTLESSTVLFPLMKKPFTKALRDAGFSNVSFYGNFKGEPLEDKHLTCIAVATK